MHYWGAYKDVPNLSNQLKKQLKTVYKSPNKERFNKANKNGDNSQIKIDAILDKISKSGYDSLSKEEKDYLFEAGKK